MRYRAHAMMNNAPTVKQYLASLPAERRVAIARVREVVNANLPRGYEEGMSFGMICWYVPFTRVAKTYNGQPLCYAGLASQKNHMALYLMGVYGNQQVETAFRKGFADAGKTLDMGKSCVRFKSLDALPLEVIGETIASISIDDFVDLYQRTRGSMRSSRSKRAGERRSTAKRAATSSIKRAAPKRAATKRPAAKRTTKPASKRAKRRA
ncbi:MAG: DUF1801 domain-containing protein [Kofleriaceae bacterium]